MYVSIPFPYRMAGAVEERDLKGIHELRVRAQG
jgi:hypothetical protein